MSYAAIVDYTPNAKRKNTAVLLLKTFQTIRDDVKTTLPYDASEWEIFEEIFGKDEFTSGYDMLGRLLVNIRESEGGVIDPRIVERAIMLVISQSQKLLAWAMSRETKFADPQKNYGIILACKMRMLADSFKTKGLYVEETLKHA